MKNPEGRIEIFRWLWRAYSRTALVPLLLVEVALVAAYLLTHNLMADANVRALREQARNRLAELTTDQALVIGARLQSVVEHTDVYRRATEEVFTHPVEPPPEEQQRYILNAQGVYHTVSDSGGAAVFYSGFVPVGEAEKRKAWRTAALDPLMKHIKQISPLVMQIYLNTHDSLNRIYPYFDVVSQYPAGMDIPSYNFYYEADARNNPERSVVWTDVYLDPAGQGWMASCIAPVYNGDFLEGVVGLDVTVELFVKQVVDLQIPWGGYALLLDRNGGIIAMPPEAESELGLTELTEHHYDEAIRREELKPDSFNIRKHPMLAELGGKIAASSTGGVTEIMLAGPKLASWNLIPQTGWTLLAFVPEDNIYAESDALADRFRTLGLLMISGMLLFYVVFFIFLFRRARDMASLLATPIRALATIAEDIGRGNYVQRIPQTPVLELQVTAEQIVSMGHALGEVNESLRAARDAAERANTTKAAFISQMTHELRTPMNAIIGFSQLLELDRDKLSAEHRDFVDHIHQSARKLLGLLNRVIEVARASSSPEQQKAAPAMISTSMASPDELIRPAAAAPRPAPARTVSAAPPPAAEPRAAAVAEPRAAAMAAAAPAPAPADMPPVDREKLLAMVAEVQKLLDANSFSALGRFKALQEMLSGRPEAAGLAGVASLMEQIRFPEAAEALRRVSADNDWRTVE